MLSDVSDIINEVLVRNNRTTTDSFITDQMLEDWLRESNAYCSTRYKWPFSEVRDYTLAWDGSEQIDYSSFTINFKADAIRLLQIGGKQIRKTSFDEYQQFREDRPSDDEKVFSDFGRIIYINPNISLTGTIAAFGQYSPTIDPTDASATTIFSTYDQEGNEAIVELMTAYLKAREHLPDEQVLYKQMCNATLDELWKKVQAEQYNYKPGRGSRGMWEHFDVVEGGYRDELFNRDQFN